jgi:hypothetical protein
MGPKLLAGDQMAERVGSLSLSPGVEGGQVYPGPRHHYGRVSDDHVHDGNQAAVQAVV